MDIDNYLYDGNKTIDDSDFLTIWIEKITTNLNLLEKMMFDSLSDVKVFL